MQQCNQRLDKELVGISILVMFFDSQVELAALGAPEAASLLFGMAFNRVVRAQLKNLGFDEQEIDECGIKTFIEHRIKNGSKESPQELEVTYRGVLANKSAVVMIDMKKNTTVSIT